MKRITIALVLGFLSTVSLFAQPRHYPSTVSEVTVYLQGAMVKRTAHINLQTGNNEIVLDGLSNYLDINSVRLESNTNMTILSVNASTNYLKTADKTPEETQLHSAWDTLTQKRMHVQNDIDAETEELDMLKQNYRVTVGNQGVYVDALENTSDFYLRRVRDALNDLTNLRNKAQDLDKRLAAINAQLAEIQNKNGTPHGEITVTATAPGYAEGDISFSYYVANAGWIPSYNMRAENDSSNIMLDYNAEVSQTTGEDWANVKLILSTGNPSVNGVKPDLAVNRLDFGAPVAYKWSNNSFRGNVYNNGRELDKMATKDINTAVTLQSSVQTDASGNISTNASNYTDLNQNILATEFEINLKYTILSDGIAKHVRVQQDTLQAKFAYSAVPKLSTDAFLQSYITGWEEYNLLPGDVNIFLENSFVGKSYIDPSTTKDTLSVSFGRDKRINIKRLRIKNYTRNQFLGPNRTQSFGYAISVRNTKNVPVDITLEDQIPVSNQKDIVVQLLESSGATLNETTGTVTWHITLQPNDSKTVKFEYSVKYPKGKMVNL